jgi:hypothetical protein
MAKTGIRNLPILDHIANNHQERCYLAISYLAIQVGHILADGFFWGLGLQPPIESNRGDNYPDTGGRTLLKND